MEGLIYITFMSSFLIRHCKSIDHYYSWMSVISKQNRERQIKYLWLLSSSHEITNIMKCSAPLGVHPETVRLYLHQSKTAGITKPLATPWNRKIEITTKHRLPVAPHKEFQVCSRFRNEGNNPTNICPTHFGDRHPWGSYQEAKIWNLLQAGEEVTMSEGRLCWHCNPVVIKTRASKNKNWQLGPRERRLLWMGRGFAATFTGLNLWHRNSATHFSKHILCINTRVQYDEMLCN